MPTGNAANSATENPHRSRSAAMGTPVAPAFDEPAGRASSSWAGSSHPWSAASRWSAPEPPVSAPVLRPSPATLDSAVPLALLAAWVRVRSLAVVADVTALRILDFAAFQALDLLASLSAQPFPVPLFDSLGAAHRPRPLLFRCIARLAVLVLALVTDLVVLLALGPVDFALYSLLFTVVLVLVNLGFSGLQTAAGRSVAASRTGAEAPFPTPLLTARLWRSWGHPVRRFCWSWFSSSGSSSPFPGCLSATFSGSPARRILARAASCGASSGRHHRRSRTPAFAVVVQDLVPGTAFFLVVILLSWTAVPLASTGAAALWLLAFAAALGVAVILFRRSRNAPSNAVSAPDPGPRSASDEGPSPRVWRTSIAAWSAGAGGVELLDQSAPAGHSSAARSGRSRGLRVRFPHRLDTRFRRCRAVGGTPCARVRGVRPDRPSGFVDRRCLVVGGLRFLRRRLPRSRRSGAGRGRRPARSGAPFSRVRWSPAGSLQRSSDRVPNSSRWPVASVSASPSSPSRSSCSPSFSCSAIRFGSLVGVAVLAGAARVAVEFAQAFAACYTLRIDPSS